MSQPTGRLLVLNYSYLPRFESSIRSFIHALFSAIVGDNKNNTHFGTDSFEIITHFILILKYAHRYRILNKDHARA